MLNHLDIKNIIYIKISQKIFVMYGKSMKGSRLN